ncbi:MAG: cytochrome P450, partial [Bradyrhizobium sp.]
MTLHGDPATVIAHVVLQRHRALFQYGAFWLDPLAAMRAAAERHGRFIILKDFVPGIPHRATIVLAVGAALNRAILGDVATWRTAGLVLPGPKGSALRRIRIGIVSLNGLAHLHYRHLISSALRKHPVDRTGDGIAGAIAKEIAAWPVGKPGDLWPLARRLVRNVAIRELFGGDLHRAHGVADTVDEHFSLNHDARVFGCPVNLPGLPYRGMLRQAEQTERCILDWAETRRGHAQPTDLLSMVVNTPDERGRIPDQLTLGGHVLTLFAASYETCQTVLTWTLFLVAQHPRVARALHDELKAALGDEAPTPERIERLPMLDAVIRESMRILPPVPFQVRVATQPTRLGGVPLPRGTRVILSPFLTNRCEEIYPQPDRFLPGRWASIDPSPFE